MSEDLKLPGEIIKELEEFPTSFKEYCKRSRDETTEDRPRKRKRKKGAITDAERQKVARLRRNEYIDKLEKKVQMCRQYLEDVQNLEFPTFDFDENSPFLTHNY